MTNPTMIKVTCPRCAGSGHFSFNLVRGTVCFGCEGAGFKIVDAKKHARAMTAKAKRDEATVASRALRAELATIVFAEMNAEFGPFPDTPKGSYDLTMACQRAYGKTPGDFVNERMVAFNQSK